MRTTLLVAVLASMSLPAIAMATDLEDMDKRLKKLEEQTQLNQAEVRDLQRTTQNAVTISGYADAEYVSSTQANTHSGFRLQHLSLFFKKNITDNWRFFSEVEYEDAPEWEFVNGQCENCAGEFKVEASSFDYLWRDNANFRFGRFFTPAGIWSQYHFPPFVATQLVPQHVQQIFPYAVDGALVYGSQSLGANTFLKYDVYLGNGEGNTGAGDQNSSKAMGGKVALWLPFAQHMEVGASGYRDTLNDGTEKKVTGSHLKVRFADITFQGEYVNGKFHPTSGPDYQSKGYYAQLAYDLRQWTFGGRHDYSNFDPKIVNDNLINAAVNSAFVNYHVSPDLVLKLEHHLINPQNGSIKDYSMTIASIVVNLGN